MPAFKGLETDPLTDATPFVPLAAIVGNEGDDEVKRGSIFYPEPI